MLASFEPNNPSAKCGFFEPETFIACERTINSPSLEGDYSWKLKGIDKRGNQFLGLTKTIPVTGVNSSFEGGAYGLQTDNADSVWFNIYVFGEGSTNTGLVVKFAQDDNEDGVHNAQSENGYEYYIDDLSHTGWKKFSVKYSTLSVSGNAAYGGNGDKIHRPQRIAEVEYALWAWNTNVEVQVIFDYPVFSYGKPHNE